MEKLKMRSSNFAEENIEKVVALFPGCVTESMDKDGNLKKSIDFDLLKQELSTHIVEGPQERYQLNWPGKREALFAANAPIAKTLRPCREESVNFDTTENLFIEGDNLNALKLLQETYLGKVKMIYIDPPYNTGKDFIYADNFAESTEEYMLESGQKDEEGNRLVANTDSNGRFHSDWLSMMYSRLKLARNLLKDDGVIFISIDDCEAPNLRKLCDEIFGEDNFLANIVWQKVHTRKNSSKYFSISHEHIIAYAREKLKWDRHLVPRDNTDAYKNPDNDSKGAWKPDPITAHNYYSAEYEIEKPNGVRLKRPQDRYWVYSKESWMEKVRKNEVIWGEGEAYPMVKRYLCDVQDGLVPITIFDRKFAGDTSMAKGELSELLELGALFDYPKPTLLIKRLQQISTSHNDIILDFFAGSATTAHAIMQLNAEDGGKRKFIMVQLPEACNEKSEAFKAGYKTIAEISKERIRRAGSKISTDYAEKRRLKKEKNNLRKSVKSADELDIGFRVLKVDSSNMADIYYTPDTTDQGQLNFFTDNIKDDRSSEDLLFQVLLDWGVDLTLPITKESISDREVFFVDGNALAACFVKNGEITEEFCKEVAKRQPLRVVFRDSGFKDDSVKINVEQIFKLMSPHTDVKTI